ncbi:hypothetical protein KCU62_g2, partial [Aureobasidium sp. EXF-3399]
MLRSLSNKPSITNSLRASDTLYKNWEEESNQKTPIIQNNHYPSTPNPFIKQSLSTKPSLLLHIPARKAQLDFKLSHRQHPILHPYIPKAQIFSGELHADFNSLVGCNEHLVKGTQDFDREVHCAVQGIVDGR